MWPIPVSADVVLGRPVLPAGLVGSTDDDWLALPTGSFVTVAFRDETIIDGPGNDIFVRSLDPSLSAGEHADVFVSSDELNFQYLGRASQDAGFSGFDLASIGFTQPVRAVKVVGVDSFGSSPGFDLVSVEVFPGSVGPGDGSHVVVLGPGKIEVGRDFGNRLTGTIVPGADLAISSQAPTSATTGSRLRYDVYTNAAPTQAITFDLPLHPEGMTIHPQLGALIWEANSGQTGLNAVVIRARDSQGRVALQSFQIDVSLPNRPPVFISAPIETFVPGTSYRYVVNALDPDGDALTYALQSGPLGMSLNTTTRELTWLPTADFAPDSVAVEVIVSDGASQTRQQFTIHKPDAASNRAPRIDSQPRTETAIQVPYLYLVHALDPDNETISYQLVSGPAGMTIDPQAILRWTPSGGQIGEHTVRVRATDGRGGHDEQQFTLSVVASPSNSAPLITSTPRTAAIDDQPYEYRAMVIDADIDPVEWSLLQAPAGMFVDPSSGLIRWTPTIEQLGTHPIILQARDPLGGTATQQFNIEVRCSNLPPTIVSIPPTIAFDGRSYVYAVRAEDAERDRVEFFLDEKPDGMGIDRDTGLIRWVPSTAQRGEQTVVIRAVDTAGGFGTQTYRVVVTDPAALSVPGDPNSPPLGNAAPLIISTPIFTGELLFEYQYDVNAIDPDGDTITYSLTQPPSGMTIDAVTGLIRWTPAANQLGQHDLTVVARDTHGATATQGFVLLIEQNEPPTITSTAPLTVTRGQVYRYPVRATDPDGDPLTYSLAAGAPTGMTIDANNGRILWDTTGRTLGSYPVEVIVSDDRGQSDAQSFIVTVNADTQAPNVNLLVINGSRLLLSEQITVNLNSQLQLRVQASDNVGVVERRLSIGGQAVSLDPMNTALVTFDEPGIFSAVATAVDAEGNVGTAVRSIRVRDPNDITGPTVRILSPADSDGQNNAQVTYITPIIGTVDDPEDQLDFWNVYMARVADIDLNFIDLADPDYRVIGSGRSEVQAGELATFDPTLLTNDRYVIFVAAFDINGQGTIRGITLDVDGNAKLGNFRLEFTDLAIPLAGIPIQVNRIYDTLQANDRGDFGFGWSLGIIDGDIRETVPDYGFNLFNIGTAPFKRDTRVYITTPDGRRLGFTFEPKLFTTVLGGVGLFGATYIPKFKADPGVVERLDVPEGINDESNIVSFDAHGNAVIPIFGFPYNPDTYILTMADGTQYTYDQRAGLQSVVDLSGNTLTVTNNGLFHSSGQSIEFVRDAQNRITQIIDPDGNLRDYAYDAAGNLISYVTSKSPARPVNNDGFAVIAEPPQRTTYAYYNSPKHFLKSITDPLGRVVLEAEFDADGRLIGTTDALGGRLRQDFDPANFTGTITDARGNITQLLYNDRGNVLSETDPLGGVIRYEYGDPLNPDKETRVIDKRGNITDRTYDTRGNVLTISERGSVTSPLATPIVTQFAYDARNQVTRITNALGRSTLFTYDSENQLNAVVNALGDHASFTYDVQGRRASFMDFNGHTTTFEYDDACPCGAPSKVVFADGTYQQLEYNTFGQLLRESNLEADSTLAETRRTKYDYEGRKIVEFGAMGQVTEYHYDGNRLVNQLTLIDFIGADPKIRLTHFEYDAADRVIRQVDTGFVWPAGTNIFVKIAEAVAAAETVVEFRYDADGNRILLQDPVGNITTWVYDANDRVIEERDPFFNLSATGIPLTIDQSLVKLQQPSGASCVTNAPAEHVTLSCYDAAGNRTKKIDRNARRSEFDYDYAGRLTEERWYAAATSDLVRTISFSYDTLGNMLTANDPDSNYVFTYDTLNRQTSVDNAGKPGAPHVILTYAYDKQGNVVSTSDNFGVTVASTYNPRNLLATRKWFDATPGTTPDVDPARVDFLYNAAGRQTRLDRYSDLTATTRVGHTATTYDLSGRTDTLIHRNAVDELLASYDYGYDFANLVISELRDHQDDQFDQSITYGYDLTGQLIDALFSGQDDEHYEYDANGNRIVSQVGSDQRTYTTGPANQLDSDSQYRYEYDGEGNQIKRIDLITGETRTFHYDHHNRLVRVNDWSSDPGDSETPAMGAILMQSVEYTYEALGRRISRSVDDAGKTLFVYNGYNIWGDFSDSGAAVARYLFGNGIDLNIARFSPDADTSWYLADSFGNIRNMSDAVGMLSQHRTFSSFGQFDDSDGPSLIDRYLFAAREFDALIRLYDNRARYFDADIGRFNSQDPLRFYAGDTNLYRYVYNSTTNGTDPTGTLSKIEFGFIAGAVAGVVRGGLGYASGEDKATAIEQGVRTGFAVGILSAVFVPAFALDSFLWAIAFGAAAGARNQVINISGVRDYVRQELNRLGYQWVHNDIVDLIVRGLLGVELK